MILLPLLCTDKVIDERIICYCPTPLDEAYYRMFSVPVDREYMQILYERNSADPALVPFEVYAELLDISVEKAIRSHRVLFKNPSLLRWLVPSPLLYVSGNKPLNYTNYGINYTYSASKTIKDAVALCPVGSTLLFGEGTFFKRYTKIFTEYEHTLYKERGKYEVISHIDKKRKRFF